MKRMFVLTVIASFLLTGVSVLFAAPVQGAPTGGKSLYSTRKAPAYRTVPPMVVEFDEVVMPQDGEFEMVVPRQAPEPPPMPLKTESLTLPPASTFSSTTKTPVLAPQPMKTEKTESTSESEAWDLSKAIDESLNRPLSGISVPTPPKKEPIGEWNPSPAKTTAQAAPKSDTPKPSFVSEPAEVDQFNARLAKIQLEKKNLDETLRLIEKIKSPNFKVKTLVDLAEYVSRDSNYKKEADRLYALAIGAIDALAENKPIVLDVKKVESVKTEAPKSTPPPRKGSLTLIDEDEPVLKPKVETPNVEAPKKEEKNTPAPLTLIDEEDETKTPEAQKNDEKLPPPPIPTRKPLTLTDEEDEAKDVSPKSPEVKKSDEKLPPPPIPTRKPLTLTGEEDEAKDVPPKSPEVKKSDEKLPPPPIPTRKPLTLVDEEDEAKDAPAATRKPLVKEIDEKPATEAAPKDEEKKTEAPKTQRRPMPGRKPIVLSDE